MEYWQLEHTLYKKETKPNHYLNYKSWHLQQQKQGVMNFNKNFQ